MLSVKSLFTIILIPFLLYVSTICPTIYWRDSPEFVDVAYTLGISHPAGSPAYSTISKIFTFLPFFSISFKINLVSLFFALLTIVFTGKVIQLLLSLCYPTIKKDEINLIVILCSLLLTIMPSFWLKAIVAEVYTMNAFFMVLILFLLLKWSINNDFRYLLIAAFLYGQSSGVHAGVILFLPGFLLFFLLVQFNSQCQWHCTPKENKEFLNKSLLKSFMLVSLFFLLGFSIYLYLPGRSVTNPEFDWGNPEIVGNFYSHITDKKDTGSHFKNITHISSLLKDSSIFIKMIMAEITLIGLLLFILGMIVHSQKDLRSFLLLFLTAFINILFYLTTTFSVYKNGILFIPSFIIFIIWIGLGIYFIKNTRRGLWPQLKNFAKKTSLYSLVMRTPVLPAINLKSLSVPVISVFLFFSFLVNFQKIDKSNYYLTEDIIKEMYLYMDPNSIIFSSQHWFANRYFQDVENLRPDLIIIHISDMKNPEIFNPVTKLRYPMLQFPKIASTNDSFYDFWPLLIKENIKERKMFVELSSVLLEVDSIPILPYKKFLMEIVDKGIEKDFNQLTESYYKDLQLSINHDISQNAFFLDQVEGVQTYYNIFLYNLANYLRQRGKFNMSLSFLNLAESLLYEKTKSIPMMRGICLAELGRYDESVLLFENLLTEYPNDKNIMVNLGNLYFKMKDFESAKQYLKKAISIDDNIPEAHFIIGMIYSKQTKFDQSIFKINKAIDITKNPIKRKKMKNFLKKVLKEKTTEAPFVK